MCNLNQVFRGIQRYHYSCCRRRTHQIMAAPSGSPRQNKTTEESIEMCCAQTNGAPAAEKASTGKQLQRKSSSPKLKNSDPSKTNPLSMKSSPTASQKKNNKKSSDSSSINKRFSKERHKVSVDNSVKIKRISGGSIEINKNKSCLCENDSTMSACSSDSGFGSPMSILSSKTMKNSQKIKPGKSKSEPQDTDLKALVRTKPKRKKIVQRRFPLCPRSSIRAIEGPKAQPTNDDDGIWFECNLPFRMNIPLPISILKLFDWPSFRNNAGQSIVPTRNGGNPFSLTMCPALPAPPAQSQPQPQPTTPRKRHRRGKLHPNPSPTPSHSICETSTQTGEEESELLRCLNEIKNQLAAKSIESRYIDEKSTYVGACQCQKKAREREMRLEERPAKLSKESFAISEERTQTTKTNKTEKKSKKIKSNASATSLKLNISSKRKPKKCQSATSTTSATSKHLSRSSLNKVPKPSTKIKKVEKKPKDYVSISSTAFSSSCSGKEALIRTKKSAEKPKKPKLSISTTSVERKLETKKEKGHDFKRPTTKPLRIVESKDKDIEENHDGKQIKAQVEENITMGIRNQRECIGPQPMVTWAVPRVFPMRQGLHYQPRYMCRNYIPGTHPMYQTPQYHGRCSQQVWPACQRNSYPMNNIPRAVFLHQSPSLPIVTCIERAPCKPVVDVGSQTVNFIKSCPCKPVIDPPKATNVKSTQCKPIVEVKKCEKIQAPVEVCQPKISCVRIPPCRPVTKASVGFCPCAQVFPAHNFLRTQGSQCPSCMNHRRTPECNHPMTQGSQCQCSYMNQRPSPECTPECTHEHNPECTPEYTPEYAPEYTSEYTQGSQCLPCCMYQHQPSACNSFKTQESQYQTSCINERQTPDYNSSMTQASHCLSSCMCQRRSLGHCCRRFCQNMPPIPISSSTEYNKKALLKKSLRKNATAKESLMSQVPVVCPWCPGVQCYRSVNCRPSAKSICFRVCPSQPQICNSTDHTNNGYSEKNCEPCKISPCWRKNQHHMCHRISSGGINKPSREISSILGTTLENKIKKQYYFPLTHKSQRSLNIQDKTNESSYQTPNLKNKTADKRQINCSRYSGRKGEACCSSGKPPSELQNRDTILYNKSSGSSGSSCSPGKPSGELQNRNNISYNKSRDGIYEDQIIVSFTNRSFSVSSEEFKATALEQKISQKPSNGCKTDDSEDTDETETGSRKSSENFKSRPINQKLNWVSENIKNIPCYNNVTYPIQQLISFTRHTSGMTKPSSTTNKKTQNRQKSPTSSKNPILIYKGKRSCSAPGCFEAVQPECEKRSNTPIYRQCLSLRNRIPSKFNTLRRDSDSESCDCEVEPAEHMPTEKIQENYKVKSKDVCRIPDYSMKATMKKVKQIGSKRGVSTSQEQERTHAGPRYKPDSQNMQPRRNREYQNDYQDSRQNPSILTCPMENREPTNDCQPDECMCSFRAKPPMPRENRDTKHYCQPEEWAKPPMPRENRETENYCQPEECFRAKPPKPRENRETKAMPPMPRENRETENYCQPEECFRAKPPKPRENRETKTMPPMPRENRETENYCQPEECFRAKPPKPSSNQLKMQAEESNQAPKKRCQSRAPSFQEKSPSQCRQNQRCTHMENPQYKDIPKMKIRKPKSNTGRSSSEKEYCSPSDYPSSRPNIPKNQNYGYCNQRDTPHKNSTILKTRLRKPSSEDSVRSSEDGYYSRTCQCSPISTSPSSSYYSSSEKSSKSVECREKASRNIFCKCQANAKPVIYSENRNKPRCIPENNSEILSSRCEFLRRTSDSESTEISPQTSNIEPEDSGRVGPCKPNNTSSKSIQSGRTTDMETLEGFTLLQPRSHCSNQSMMIRNSDIITENTVLFEIRTTCKKDNLLETCARPPCTIRHKKNAAIPPTDAPVKSPNYHPQNKCSCEEKYHIDPRNHWSPSRSSDVSATSSCQQQIQIQNYPEYQPQLVRQAIEVLPVGFYDQTIQQYNIIRMDSDFQPPHLGSEIIQAVQAFPQSHCGCPGCPCGNPIQQKMMTPVQDFSRPFILPQNQIQQRQPTEPTLYCTRQPRKS